MHDLIALTPLGALAPVTFSHGALTLAEVTDTALVSVTARSGAEDAVQIGLATLLGTPAPGPAKACFGPPYGCFWTGPDQWMVEAPLDAGLAAAIKTQLGDGVSVTDQTDGWCRFDLTGPDIAAVMERLCPVDLTAEPGLATRSTIEHLGCFVILRAPQHLSILGPRSAADSIFHAVKTTMISAL